MLKALFLSHHMIPFLKISIFSNRNKPWHSHPLCGEKRVFFTSKTSHQITSYSGRRQWTCNVKKKFRRELQFCAHLVGSKSHWMDMQRIQLLNLSSCIKQVHSANMCKKHRKCTSHQLSSTLKMLLIPTSFYKESFMQYSLKSNRF